MFLRVDKLKMLKVLVEVLVHEITCDMLPRNAFRKQIGCRRGRDMHGRMSHANDWNHLKTLL